MKRLPVAISRGALSLALQLVGSILLSYAIGVALQVGGGGGSAAASAAYHVGTCSGCPAGATIDSVEVQARDGSTLFVVGGTLPDRAGDLPADVLLQANGVVIQLHPVKPDAFEIVRATNLGQPLPPDAIAAGIQRGSLLIDVRGALTAPVSFVVGFWNGTDFRGRIPEAGALRWDGTGIPQPTRQP